MFKVVFGCFQKGNLWLFSPDCSENPLLPGFGSKDYSGERDGVS